MKKKNYEKEELEKKYKEDAWKQILKRNENDFSNAFEGFRGNKNKFIEELQRRIKNHKGELNERKNLIDRSSVLFKRKPVSVENLYEIPEYLLKNVKKISEDSIWNQVIFGSDDVEIAKLIKKWIIHLGFTKVWNTLKKTALCVLFANIIR